MKLEHEQFLIERTALFQAAPIPYFALDTSIAAMQRRNKSSVMDVQSSRTHLLVQPRCGVADHGAMRALLCELEASAQPDLLTLTIDSYTRLNQYDKADPATMLNGYPLIHHGPARGWELEQMVQVPLQVRHGSPDGRLLAEVTYAAGITAFEGGGISYNLPYCKRVPLTRSLKAWQYIDRLTALLSDHVVIDRETFGTLTAVLVPPSLSIAISILEVLLAVEQGVQCVTVSFPQSGSLIQDVAALRLIPRLCQQYLQQHSLPPISIFTSYHQWMGVFPQDSASALALMATGVIAATAGNATKLINKTYVEAQGIPTSEANAMSIRYCHAMSHYTRTCLAFEIPQAAVEEEGYWMAREVDELLQTVFRVTSSQLSDGVVTAFANGALDIPFSPSVEARGHVIPARARNGAIRYLSIGALPFSAAVRQWNQQSLQHQHANDYQRVLKDIAYLAINATAKGAIL